MKVVRPIVWDETLQDPKMLREGPSILIFGKSLETTTTDTFHSQTCPYERQLLTVWKELDGKLEETKDGSQVRTLWSGGTMQSERCCDITNDKTTFWKGEGIRQWYRTLALQETKYLEQVSSRAWSRTRDYLLLKFIPFVTHCPSTV